MRICSPCNRTQLETWLYYQGLWLKCHIENEMHKVRYEQMAVRKVTSWQAQEPQDTLGTSRREEFGTITLLTHVYRAFPDSISELACFGLQLEVVMACAIWVSYLVFLGFSRIYRRCPCYETAVSLFLSCSSVFIQWVLAKNLEG